MKIKHSQRIYSVKKLELQRETIQPLSDNAVSNSFVYCDILFLCIKNYIKNDNPVLSQ